MHINLEKNWVELFKHSKTKRDRHTLLHDFSTVAAVVSELFWSTQITEQ